MTTANFPSDKDFIKQLEAAVNTYDRATAVTMAGQLITRCQTIGSPYPARASREILLLYRRARLFAEMDSVGSAICGAGEDDPAVRAEWIQAMIDSGKPAAAEAEARRLLRVLEASEPKPVVYGKAKAHLGRIEKDRFVSTGSSDNLDRAINWYAEALAFEPGEYWYAINLIALMARAERDKITVTDKRDYRASAREILKKLTDRDRDLVERWDLGTAAEASLAVGDIAGVHDWLGAYIRHPKTDAFSLAATQRQFREVWGLSEDDDGPGGVILPVLRQALAARPGGTISMSSQEIRFGYSDRAQQGFEGIWGNDTGHQIIWYRRMLDQARSVGRIARRVEPQKGLGTGFLVRAHDFFPQADTRFGEGEWLLLTNSHVVSNASGGILRPTEGVVGFEVLCEDTTYAELGELVWESPRDDLDVSFVRLAGAPLTPRPPLQPYDFVDSDAVPLIDPAFQRRYFVIGHPLAGPLQISLQDSLQVGWVDPLLRYRTPTESGSSGSPVFDEDWRLAAVHHRAVKESEANEGIWIHAIRRRLHARQ